MSKLTNEERNKLNESDFGDPEGRKFPILDQDDVDSAAHLIGKAGDPDKVKARIISIAKKKGLKIPEAWEEGKSFQENDLEIFFGSEIKDFGSGKIGGYAALFTTAEDPDLQGEYFTSNTNFNLDINDNFPIYYSHGLNEEVKDKRFGKCKLIKKDAGLWAEAQLQLADEYDRQVYELVKKGKLKYSTGSAANLIQRVSVKGSREITSWPIVELSLTPTPVEPRTSAFSIKSINFQSNFKMIHSERMDLLRSAISEKHGTSASYMDHDDENVFFHDFNADQLYGAKYKLRNKEGIDSVKMEDPFPVRRTVSYQTLPVQLNNSKLDIGGHPKGSVLAAKSSITSELQTSSLKDHFEICLSNLQGFTNRLNKLKDLRIDRKSLLNSENLERLKLTNRNINLLISICEDTEKEHREAMLATKALIYDIINSDTLKRLS